MSIHIVPFEILDEIIQKIDDKDALYSLSRVNKILSRIAKRYIHKYKFAYADGCVKKFEEIFRDIDDGREVNITFIPSTLLWIENFPKLNERLKSIRGPFYYNFKDIGNIVEASPNISINYDNNTYSIRYTRIYYEKKIYFLTDSISGHYYITHEINRNFLALKPYNPHYHHNPWYPYDNLTNSEWKLLNNIIGKFTYPHNFKVTMPTYIEDIPFLRIKYIRESATWIKIIFESLTDKDVNDYSPSLLFKATESEIKPLLHTLLLSSSNYSLSYSYTKKI